MDIEKHVGEWDFPSLTKHFEALIEAQRQIREQCSEIVKERQAWSMGLGFCITHWRNLTNTKPSELARLLGIELEQVLSAEKGHSKSILQILRMMYEKRMVAGCPSNMIIPTQYYGPQGEDGARE